MKPFILTLRMLALMISIIAILHGFLGHGAESLLGIPVPLECKNDASQDSQNRFFGLAFALYGVVLVLVSRDPARYITLFHATLLVFFVAGLGRLLSMLTHALPAPPVIGLAVVELLAPPLLYVWSMRALSKP